MYIVFGREIYEFVVIDSLLHELYDKVITGLAFSVGSLKCRQTYERLREFPMPIIMHHMHLQYVYPHWLPTCLNNSYVRCLTMHMLGSC